MTICSFFSSTTPGARVSEAISVRVQDVQRHDYRAVELLGKGRKQRTVPLWKETTHHIRAWLKLSGLKPDQPFAARMSRTAVQQRLRLYVRAAQDNCPLFAPPSHIASHHPAHQGHAFAPVRLPSSRSGWGMKIQRPTHQYIEADLAMKETALRDNVLKVQQKERSW